MEILAQLLVRELVLLALLTALGSGVVALAAPGLAPVVRVALAPAAGLALGACALTTAHLLIPMKTGAFVIFTPLVLGSLAIAVVKWRRGLSWRLGWGELLQLAIVIAAVAAVANWPLVERDSLGPIGYSVFDANSYVNFDEGSREGTLVDDVSNLSDNPDLTYRNWAYYSKSFVLVRSGHLQASAVTLFGWGSSDLQTAFMAMTMLVGALALFGVVRLLTGTRSWTPAASGVLFGGPLFVQLYIDGSEALLAGLALMPAAIAATVLLVEERSVRTVLFAALLGAGLHTLHPVFMVLVAIWIAGFVAAFALAWLWRRRGGAAEGVRRVGPKLLIPAVAVGLLTLALSPVSLVFNIRFYEYANQGVYSQGLPQYALPIVVMPSWLLQTREFFFLPSDLPTFEAWWLTVLAPLLIVAAVVYGVVRYRKTWIVLLFLPPLVAWGLFAYTRDCSYCVQRNTLPIGPVAAVLVGVGLTAVWEIGRRWGRVAAVLLGAAIVLMAGHKSWVEGKRVAQGGYAIPGQARTIAQALDGKDGAIYLEAFGQGRNGPAAMEMPALYNLMNQATDERLALSIETNDYSGLTYLIGQRGTTKFGAEFTPAYRWIVTRVASIETDRRLVVRHGPFALLERQGPLDVSITNGIAVDEVDRDPFGNAWVQGPMTFWTVGSPGQPAALHLTFESSTPVRIAVPGGARVEKRTPRLTTFCLPVADRSDLRRTTVEIPLKLPPDTPAPDEFGLPSPPMAVRLHAMRATIGGCAASRRDS